MKQIYLDTDGSKKALENLDYIGGLGRWYCPIEGVLATSSTSHTGIGYRFVPFYLKQKIEIDGLGYIQGTNASSGVTKLAVYNMNRTTQKPSTKVIETADFVNNVTGGRAISITPTVLNVGLYFFANIANNTSAFNVTTITSGYQQDLFGADSVATLRSSRKGWIYTTTYVDGTSAISDFTSLAGDLTIPTINNILHFFKISAFL